MSENKRYYYLKLKETFFTSETIMILENMPDGLIYSNLLLKMYLMSLKDEGQLLLNSHIPHTPRTIATCTRHQEGTVERGIEIFRQLGLVEQLTNGVYYMTNIQMMIGQSSTEGERKKRERMRLAQSNLLPDPPADICPPELEKEKQPELKQELTEEREENGTREKPNPYYARLGRYENVFLREQDVQELKDDFPDQWEAYIQRLSEYMESTGRHYRNHAATIRRWISLDEKKAPASAMQTYTFKEGESL